MSFPLSLCSPSENTHLLLADPEDHSAEARTRLVTIINGWENLSSVCSFCYLTFQRLIAGHSVRTVLDWMDTVYIKAFSGKLLVPCQVPGC